MDIGSAIPLEAVGLAAEKSLSSFNQATATAEQMAGAGGPTTTLTVDNSGGSSDSYTPSLPGCATIKTLYRTNITNLDITDGFLKQLPICRYYETDQTANTYAEVTTPAFHDIPMNVFAGIRAKGDIDDSGTSTSSLTDFDTWTGDQELAYYPWNRWLGSKIQLKDFMFVIERDSSGGVQMINDPKFEVIFYPTSPFTRGDSSQVAYPEIIQPYAKYNGYRFITNFDQGLDINIAGKSGWGIPSDMFHVNDVTPTGMIRYFSFREWQGITADDATTSPFFEVIPRQIQLDTPMYAVAFRWLNRLVQTNIKITMSYSVQVESTWQGMFKNIHYDAFYLNQPGTTGNVEPALVNKNKKRKLKEIQ